MGRIVACANQKGGVGKTTTVVNLGTYLALAGDRVLIVDLDPQGNTTSGFGIDRGSLERSVYDALTGATSLEELVQDAAVPGLRIVPAAIALAGAEVELATVDQRERRLRAMLRDIATRYDHVLVDCPPSLGLLTVNALTAADEVLIPIQSEYYALEGLTQLIATINLIRDHLNPDLAVRGVVLTMYDSRLNLCRQVANDAREYFGETVLRTVIPRNVRLAEAPSFGKPVLMYDVQSVGAKSYLSAAQELLRRTEAMAAGGAA